MDYIIKENNYWEKLNKTLLYHEAGKVSKSMGLVYEVHLPGAAVGSLCTIYPDSNTKSHKGIDAEVIGFNEKHVLLMPFEDVQGVNIDSLVVLKHMQSVAKVGDSLLGRVLDGAGSPIDGLGELTRKKTDKLKERNLYEKPVAAYSRKIIEEPLSLGIRAIDGLLTCGKGQRVGIFAGSGIGKSLLLGMMARNTSADVNVIALTGERGREVREFIERDLGPEGLARSVVVVATSDKSPLLRMRSAFLAATIAEYFRDKGKDVLFMMDSVTRFCMAQREIGLSMGEPPASKGYTPSVFSTLPKLLERAGTKEGRGSITGLYTVLVEGDDLDDPVADSARSILDGHVILSRKLAERNHYPAIDVLQSTSRVMTSVINNEHKGWASKVREWLALYAQTEDLISIGAYVKGTNPEIDQAVEVNKRIKKFLIQGVDEKSSFEDAASGLLSINRAGEAFFADINEANKTQIQKQRVSF